MNVVLLGYRATGKTSVGRRVAAMRRLFFCDTDDLVRRTTGKTIRELVAEGGWLRFRAEEKRAIATLAAGDGMVIALGGGAVLDPENVAALKTNGCFVWLRADVETIVRRIVEDPASGGQRPALARGGLRDETAALLAERTARYAEVADCVVDTAGRDLASVAAEVSRIAGEWLDAKHAGEGERHGR